MGREKQLGMSFTYIPNRLVHETRRDDCCLVDARAAVRARENMRSPQQLPIQDIA